MFYSRVASIACRVAALAMQPRAAMSSAFTAASPKAWPRLSTRLLAYGAQLALYSISGIARSTPSPQIAVHGVMGRGIAHPRHCHQNGAGRQRGAHSTHGGDARKCRRVAEHRDPSVRDDRARPGPLRLAQLGRERAPARKGGLALLLLLHVVDAVNLYDVVRRPPPRRSASFFVLVERPAQVPKLIYATAHKRHRTAELVKKAFDAGFRGVDTAHGEQALQRPVARLWSTGLRAIEGPLHAEEMPVGVLRGRAARLDEPAWIGRVSTGARRRRRDGPAS